MVLKQRNIMRHNIEETQELLDKEEQESIPTKSCASRYIIAWSDAYQVMPPFFLAGFGTLSAGLLLAEVQHWQVFQTISELFVLVPALLGLKGNLAMTLASRLSTETHRGISSTKYVVRGYLSLDQAQALIVGLLASFIAIIAGLSKGGSLNNMVILSATAVITASLVSITLGGLMCLIVLGAGKCNFNPDNIATPIAASLGDVITLSILSVTAHLLFQIQGRVAQLTVCCVVISLFMTIIPPLIYYAWKNPYARPAVLQGWAPILMAMLISSGVGIIMSQVSDRFPTVLGFLPIINGIGGNLAAIQASRLSTSFNLTRKIDFNEMKMSIFLLLLVVPGHAVFLGAKYLIEPEDLTAAFYMVYFSSALLQVTILLSLSYVLVMISPHVRNIDPDIYCIPLLTALGDFLGTALLTLTTVIIDNMGYF